MNLFKLPYWARIFRHYEGVEELEKEHDEYLMILKKEEYHWRKNIVPAVREQIKNFVKINWKFAEYVAKQQEKKIKERLEAGLQKANTAEEVVKLKPLADRLDNNITPAMISRAEEYPLDNLVSVNSQGFAKCVNHNDTNPSMYCKNNYAYCFSCGWTGNSIKVYRKLNNCGFVEAVNNLQ